LPEATEAAKLKALGESRDGQLEPLISLWNRLKRFLFAYGAPTP